MPATPRQRARERTMAEIVRIGRAHLATEGAAALSLRAVARDLGVVSSAVYRYVANRDELLTLLVIDAYTELADEVDAAVDAAVNAQAPGRDLAPGEEVAVIARALRAWALREPARYALLYGSPVPGYHAPAEQTNEPGTRVVGRLLRLLAAADPADRSPGSPPAPVEGRLADDLAAVAAELGEQTGAQVDLGVLAAGMLAWNAILGAVSAEVFGWYGPTFDGSAEQLFDHQVAGVVALLAQAGVR